MLTSSKNIIPLSFSHIGTVFLHFYSTILLCEEEINFEFEMTLQLGNHKLISMKCNRACLPTVIGDGAVAIIWLIQSAAQPKKIYIVNKNGNS